MNTHAMIVSGSREGMKDALLWIMLEYWDQYIELGLKQTKSQVEAVSRWKQTASRLKCLH